jgi:predicted alpha-1,2-mannosidase
MKLSIFSFLFAIVLLNGCTSKTETDFTKYVNPFIGTSGSKLEGHGNAFPGAAYPFGMVQLSPDNGKSGPYYCSGYFYKDDIISGFSHTHLSGTGAGDLVDISFMPTTKQLKEECFTQPDTFIRQYCNETGLDISEYYDPEKGDVFKKNILLKYRSKFSHNQEKASPGYYSVKLLDDDIDVELTVTEFTGFHRYTFNKPAEEFHVILNLGFAINRGRPVKTYLEQRSPNLFVGYRFSEGWADHQKVFFALEFKDAPIKLSTFDVEKQTGKQFGGKDLKAAFTFDAKKTNTVLFKVGLSSGSIEGALADLKTVEKYGWDFDKVKNGTRLKWNKELSKVKITTADEDKKAVFYTALYHSYLAPYRFSDVQGEYKGYNNNAEKAEGYKQYTVLSLWDTFRALQPFLLIMQPELYSDIVNSMLAQYKQTGMLPYWEIAGNEGGSMIGYHSVPVITDAILKGVGNFDKELAFMAMIDASNTDRKGLGYYRKYGFVPTDKEQSATVSKTLEYAYDDWCIAQAAKYLGKEKEYAEYMKRSEYYRNVFDPEYKLMRGKNSDGTWYEPFHPRFGQYGNPHYVEANAWQYSFFVPHNTEALIELMGGKTGFEMMMDSLFNQSSEILGEDTEDIVGRIGQYAHGNEPSHHVAYLYDFIGKDHKTQHWVNKIFDSLYTNTPDGLCGNDDCGQMSAWYVFSGMGFYPVNPLDGKYYIGAPQFEKTELLLPNGKTFTVTANNISDKNRYIKSTKLNGKLLKRPYITYEELIKGGTLEFEMQARTEL